MGATSACNPHKSDFVELKMKINPKKLKGISEVLKIEGIVTVEYTIYHNREDKITLRVPEFYVTQLSSDLRIIY